MRLLLRLKNSCKMWCKFMGYYTMPVLLPYRYAHTFKTYVQTHTYSICFPMPIPDLCMIMFQQFVINSKKKFWLSNSEMTLLDIHDIVWCTWHCLWQLKKGGGLSFNSTLPLTKCSEKLVQLILHEYSILSHLTEITLPPSNGLFWLVKVLKGFSLSHFEGLLSY